MTTLMQWGNSDGIQGRCDDKCHSATNPHCECMCGGRFHGASLKDGGLEKQVELYQDEVVEYANKRLQEEGLYIQIDNISQFMDIVKGQKAQLSMFE